jgi:hypothetical protein
MIMRRYFWSFSILTSINCVAQEQDEGKKSRFDLSGYVEVYYVFDFNRPKNHTRPDFVYSYNRSNEVNLNLAFIKGSYNTDRSRANLALMTGTYTNANMKNEAGALKNIFEANVGAKLSEKRNLWIDAGIFPSHIGFESAVGRDSWNLTRSILADNSPYFETGVKISYSSDNNTWLLSCLVLNGWQRIQMIDGNSMPSFGTQFTFKPSEIFTLNSSSFIGTDKPDSVRQMRYFHNLYWIFQLSDRVGITAGFDSGLEEKLANSGYNWWYSPIVTFRANLTDKISFDFRGEYYLDRKNAIVKTVKDQPFSTKGISCNMDYQIAENVLWRIEVRHLSSSGSLYLRNGQLVKNDTTITTCLAVAF